MCFGRGPPICRRTKRFAAGSDGSQTPTAVIDDDYSADYDSCVGLGENGDCYTQPFGFETTPSAHRNR